MNIKSRIANLAFRVLWQSPGFRKHLEDVIQLRIEEGIIRHKAKVNADGNPGLGVLWHDLKDIDLLRSNVKQLGLHMARILYEQGEMQANAQDSNLPLTSRLCRQEDFAEPWFRRWCDALHLKPLLHRKIWEYAFVAQGLQEHGSLQKGTRGIGFGCGEEPMASFFASLGINVTVTDLAPEKSKDLGWVTTGQHTSSLQQAFYPDLITKEDFDARVSLEYVDMNAIPTSLAESYDFCWSICALEHLGSIRNGLDFIKNSLSVLKPGGVAIHTTEFNLSDGDTIDNWQTVLFQKKHIDLLADELRSSGHELLPFCSDPGNAFLDKFVDLPPYDWESIMQLKEPAHLKVAIDGFPSTCIGIIVRKQR